MAGYQNSNVYFYDEPKRSEVAYKTITRDNQNVFLPHEMAGYKNNNVYFYDEPKPSEVAYKTVTRDNLKVLFSHEMAGYKNKNVYDETKPPEVAYKTIKRENLKVLFPPEMEEYTKKGVHDETKPPEASFKIIKLNKRDNQKKNKNIYDEYTEKTKSFDIPLFVTLPPFIPSDPVLWFAMAERAFEAGKISSVKLRYQWICNAVRPKYSANLKEFVSKPLSKIYPKSCYDILKAAIIREFGKPDQQVAKVQSPPEPQEVAEKKPSEILRYLQGVVRTDVPQDTVRELWLNQLPQKMQTILKARQNEPLEMLAVLADKLVVFFKRIKDRSTAAKSGQKDFTTLGDEFVELNLDFDRQISAIREEIHELMRETQMAAAGHALEPCTSPECYPWATSWECPGRGCEGYGRNRDPTFQSVSHWAE